MRLSHFPDFWRIEIKILQIISMFFKLKKKKHIAFALLEKWKSYEFALSLQIFRKLLKDGRKSLNFIIRFS